MKLIFQVIFISLITMNQVQSYMNKHEAYIQEHFSSMAKTDTIEATKIFSFLQKIFDKEEFIFLMKGQDFFSDDQNNGELEKLLQSYYRQTQEDKDIKFYLYRIQFTLLEIKYILEFWISREPELKIVYNLGEDNQIRSQTKEEDEDNEFDLDDDEIPQQISEYKKQINTYKEELEIGESSEQGSEQMRKKIADLSYKIKVLEQRLKTVPQKEELTSNKQKDISSKQIFSSISQENKINYQAIFQFYAKQMHLTGIKATFDRIEHETQAINYQKLVHFLREFNLMPTKATDHKKVHLLYVKNCQKTRDLNLKGFMKFLQGISLILFPTSQQKQRQALLKNKFLQRKIKGLKLLNNPFHSLEKEDFRINSEQIKYQFKLKPQDGKLVDEIAEELELRRKHKLEEKSEKQKIKEQHQIKKLKRLQSLDPWNPLVLKNAKLLQQKGNVEPIATLDNMEKYRDKSFDFDSLINRSPKNNRTPRNHSLKMDESIENISRREETMNKISKLQRYEMEKMNSLMSGIIERSNAKMHKLGISPAKAVKFV